MMMSVRLISRIAYSGVSPSEQRLVTLRPSIEAIRTRPVPVSDQAGVVSDEVSDPLKVMPSGK
jgi:hypothetical protein